MSTVHHLRVTGACLATAMLAGLVLPMTVSAAEVAQTTACRAEVEPNDSLESAVSLAGASCASGTLVDVGDEDVFLWQVDEIAAADTWTLSLEGSPEVAPSARVVRVERDTESGAAALGAELGRVTYGVDEAEMAAEADLELEAGTYAIVVGRSGPAEGAAPPEEPTYVVRLTPSDEAGATTTTDQNAAGRIAVVANGEAVPMIGGDGAMELVLDTSGSMLERLEGTTKLKIAQRSLVELVDELPTGLPVALRTFKAKPRSCATVLRVPVEPLRAKAMKQTIMDLPARKGTRTPIAKAISKVPEDLAGASGHRVVVLVTDGKEDCGGDPAAAITALSRDGYTATVHIIGYALPDDAEVVASLSEWAALGGGRFFEAPDRAGLAAALEAATTAPYLVFDQSGALVAQGLVGDGGVEIGVGVYRVEVLTDPAVTFETVELEAGADIELPADGVARSD